MGKISAFMRPPPLIGLFLLLALIVYNIYFHPLSSYPGPKACAATRIPYFRYLLGGGLVRQVAKWHEQYGEVVRIAPDELSYTSSTAWRDIYGSRQGHAQNPKDPRFYSAPVSNSSDEVVSENGDPSRYRRSLAHAFSESPVREQEPIIQGYVDLLIERLHGKIGMGARPVDMVAWYSFTTFDIIRDLTFGESFGCLRNSRYHDWISMIFKQIRVGVYVNVMKRMPGGQVLLRIISKFIASPKENRTVLTAEAAQNHLKNGSERLDYLSHILKQKEPSRQLTVPEIIANSNAFIIAGSETTATALSGVTYYLLSETRVMKKLVEEVRGAFSTEGDITISSVSKLPYILAVVNEGLRMYPPVPIGLPRVVKGKGIVVDGKWVPGKTAVAVSQMSANRSPLNFTQPNSFIPDRFLDEPDFRSDNRSALQPFSFGPRNCLGRSLAYAEMRLILARVIWNFDMELEPESADWADQNTYFLWEKRPLKVRLVPVGAK